MRLEYWRGYVWGFATGAFILSVLMVYELARTPVPVQKIEIPSECLPYLK